MSYAYAPSVGGIERINRMLAEEFVAAGHEVKILTHTLGEDDPTEPAPIFRRPDRKTLWKLHRWADVVYHRNISLTYAWPVLLLRKPWVIAHTGELYPGTRAPLQARLKLLLFRRARNIAITQFVSTWLPPGFTLIGNPYDDAVFRRYEDVSRERDIVYLGRLVSDKGCDTVVQALGILKGENMTPSLTIIGDGPEEESLRRQASELGVQGQVRFRGRMEGEALARELNRHHVQVVPSKVREGFGIVALEGTGCGCVILGSNHGGLPEAIGPCGLTVPPNDPAAWAEKLRFLLESEEPRRQFREAATAYLAEHTRAGVAGRYLSVFESAIGRKRQSAKM